VIGECDEQTDGETDGRLTYSTLLRCAAENVAVTSDNDYSKR